MKTLEVITRIMEVLVHETNLKRSESNESIDRECRRVISALCYLIPIVVTE